MPHTNTLYSGDSGCRCWRFSKTRCRIWWRKKQIKIVCAQACTEICCNYVVCCFVFRMPQIPIISQSARGKCRNFNPRRVPWDLSRFKSKKKKLSAYIGNTVLIFAQTIYRTSYIQHTKCGLAPNCCNYMDARMLVARPGNGAPIKNATAFIGFGYGASHRFTVSHCAQRPRWEYWRTARVFAIVKHVIQLGDTASELAYSQMCVINWTRTRYS